MTNDQRIFADDPTGVQKQDHLWATAGYYSFGILGSGAQEKPAQESLRT